MRAIIILSLLFLACCRCPEPSKIDVNLEIRKALIKRESEILDSIHANYKDLEPIIVVEEKIVTKWRDRAVEVIELGEQEQFIKEYLRR
jgi:hypothetical protein